MVTSEAFVKTGRADRYLAQLARHAGQMQRHFGNDPGGRHDAGEPPSVEEVEASGAEATLTFAGGSCLISARPQGLQLRLEAEEEESLRRLQDGVGKRLETLGTKDLLKVVWSGSQNGQGTPSRP
jgi:hypothetical protein